MLAHRIHGGSVRSDSVGLVSGAMGGFSGWRDLGRRVWRLL